MDRRVVITGVGLVTPVGIGIDEPWSAICSGKSGISEITRFDTSGYSSRIAGQVIGFKTEDFLPRKEAKRTQLFVAYAVAATRFALEDSRFEINASNADRTGVITGCGFGGLEMLERLASIVENKGPKRVSPFFVPMLISNMAPGMISIHFGARGPNASVATACAAGTHAVGYAYQEIKQGKADAMITGGVESVITPTCLAGFGAMKALSTRNSDPEKASRPFDRDRDGFVVGEGAGMLILESLEGALERGARIYGEIAGFGMSGDGYHVAMPSPDGEGAARCMQAALDDAGMAPDRIDYINAHGTATPMNDLYETQAIKSVFGDAAKRIAVSSTKSMTGHLLGGAGGIETVFTTLSVYHDIAPPTINLDQPGEELDLDYVPHTARKKTINTAMSNSFGFGGTNGVLIIKKYQP